MKLLITLRPIEPFFFGGDRVFAYGETVIQRSGGYYIRSLETPSQTTLLGVLRYLGMEKREISYKLAPSDVERIGSESFNLRNEIQSFGMIRGISGLFIMDPDHKFYIKTPFDHQKMEAAYTPWGYSAPLETIDGPRLIPLKGQYSVKDGHVDNWLCLNDLSIHEDLIWATTQVGVSTFRDTDGFYKKEYRRLREGLSFAFFAEVDAGFSFPEQIVYLGQKKSAFMAAMTPINDRIDMQVDLNKLRETLHPQAAVALSDVYLRESVDASHMLYKKCVFVCAGIREHRTFATNYQETVHLKRFKKGEELIRLVSAGSIFLVAEEAARTSFLKMIDNPHARMAGYNHLVYGKEWKVS